MVRNVRSIDEDDDDHKQHQVQQSGLELIDQLAANDKNINIMIKERTVAALTEALQSPKSPVKGGSAFSFDNQYIAAKALGTITSHRGAAMRIGRDEKTIKTV